MLGKVCRRSGMVYVEKRCGCQRCVAYRARDNVRRHAKQRAHGRDRRDVRRAMDAAIRRDGRCLTCGSTDDLTAHLDPALAGHHTTDPADYSTACRSCHGRLDAPRARRRRR
jgi:hypothetical protein